MLMLIFILTIDLRSVDIPIESGVMEVVAVVAPI